MREPVPDAELLALAEPIRRVAAARLAKDGVGDGAHVEDVEDVVQETLTRVLEVSHRLDRDALEAYAVVTAKNYISSRERERVRGAHHVPRLVDPPTLEGPDAQVLRQEEQAAVSRALDQLSRAEAQLLLQHEVSDIGTGKLAADQGSSPAAVAARLARARARLRLEFLLALRRVDLPTPRCRPVLLALSAGDRRRQRALHAGTHLRRCPTCGALSEPLLTRRRGLAGLLPWLGLGGGAPPSPRARAQQLAIGSVTLAVLTAAVVVITRGERSPTPPETSARAAAAPAASPAVTPAAGLTVRGRPLLPRGGEGLRELVGAQVVARDVRVVAVPADEGFWMGSHPRDRVWVRLPQAGESPVKIRPGQHLDFLARVVAHSATFPRAAGVTIPEGAEELARQGAHLVADPATVRRR